MTRHRPAFAALALVFGSASAQDYEGVTALVIEDAIATVTITPGDSVSVEGTGEGDRPLSVMREGGSLVLAGPGRVDEDRFWDEYAGGGLRIGPVRLGGGRSVTVRNGRDARFEEVLKSYPTVTITLPEGTDLRVSGSALLLSSSAALGQVQLSDDVYLRAALGDARSADLELSGAGRIELGDVRDAVLAGLTGSGDVVFGEAGSAEATLRGSGDVRGGSVRGDAVAELTGSGDLALGEVGGGARLSLRGSGDLAAGRVAGPLKVELRGSGDVDVASVDASVSIVLRGSGDVEIEGGRADPFEATLSGSGDVEFGGVAVNPRLRSSGSGDIDVAEYEGEIQASGDGIRVAGRRYGAD